MKKTPFGFRFALGKLPALLVALVSLLASTARAASIQSGSPYDVNLVSMDAPNYTLLWEGTRLMGTGTLTEWSFFSGAAGRTITPLLFRETAGSYEVAGVGTPRTSAGAGAYEEYPFEVVSGSAAVSATDGSRYYLGFSVSDTGSPITLNNNGLDNQGMNLRYVGGYATETGPVSFVGVAARHYTLRAKVELDAPVLATRGEMLMRRYNVDDYANGFIVDRTPLAATGEIMRWVGFAKVDPNNAAVTRELTPVLFRETGGVYTVHGVGAVRALTDGFFEYDFELQSGSATVLEDANYCLGWRYGRMDGSGGNGGSLSFNLGVGQGDVTASDQASYFNPGAVPVGVGYTPVLAGTQERNYSFAVMVRGFQAPVIVRLDPSNATVYVGYDITLGVVATGAGTLSYQWQHDGEPLSGETNATLLLAQVQASQAGPYTVVVSNAYGSVTSAPSALLTVLAPPPVATGGIAITEFMAENHDTLADEDGDFPDWIELQNQNPFPVNLAGWHLTDQTANLARWVFPLTVLQPGEFLVVFASGKDRPVPGAPLHTNFRLDADGGWLALVMPDGTTIAQAFAYGSQRADVSYGTAVQTVATALVPPGAGVSYLVPWDGSAGLDWTGGHEPFDESFWGSGLTAFGFDTIGTPAVIVETAGNPLLARANYDTAIGSIFVQETGGFIQTGEVGQWAFQGMAGFNITPLVLRQELDNTFTITGIGATRTGNGQPQTNAFALVTGSASVGPGYYLGWKDGSNGADNTGTPSFDLGSEQSVRWFGQHTGFALHENLGAGQSFGRTYSLQFHVQQPLSALVQTSVAAEMLGRNASLCLRAAFPLSGPPAFGALTLRVRYEDGFVAWLNGVEVARQNAPAALQFDSTSLADRPAALAGAWEEIDLTTAVPFLHDGINILAIQALNDSAGSGDFLIEPELTGYTAVPQPNRFMAVSTPGGVNAPGVLGFVADTKFDPNRGFYAGPFSLSITSATADAEIWFTTDGSVPSPTNAQAALYTGPITVERTTTLRAAGFKTDFEPSHVDTHTFIFLADAAQQRVNPPGFPAAWAGFPADYEVDPQVIAGAAPGHDFLSALLSLPAMSLVTDPEDMFGAARGIYCNAAAQGPAWERVASIELIHPEGTNGFQANAGLRVHGGASRSHGWTLKHSFQFAFRDRYGPRKLHYPLFPDSAVQDFDQLILRACFTDSWPSGDGYVDNGLQRWSIARATYMRDQWMRDAQRDLGQPMSHGRYVNLWVNGLYWGLYNLCERLDNGWAGENLSGSSDEYDVIKDYVEVESGNAAAWNEMMNLAGQGLATEAAYQRIQGNNPDAARNPAYPVYLHMTNFVDYMMLHIYGGAEDWPGHNWWASRRRGTNSEGFRFYVWDQEIAVDSLERDRVISGFGSSLFEEVNTPNSPAFLYDKLRANASFRQLFADRAYRAMTGQGALTPAQCAARWEARQNEIDYAIVGESARWGDARREPPFTREGEWLPEMNWQAAFWASNHTRAVARFQRVGLYPSLMPPALSHSGGYFTAGFDLEISHTNGTGAIWLTLDGSDPRAASGAPSPGAQLYGASIPVAGPLQVRARVRDGVNWSPPAEALFLPAQALTNLVMTEIYYNPPGAPGVDGEQFEFLELQNHGSVALDLSGFQFTEGISFVFGSGTLLGPGAYFVLARDPATFAARFPGATINGLYTGKLSNGGEAITLVDALGNVVSSFAYGDSDPWPADADGAAASLQRVNFVSSPAAPGSWAAGAPTPGSAPPADILSDLRIDSIVVDAGVALTFHALAARTYTVQWTDDPGSGLWNKLADLAAYPTNHVPVVMDPTLVNSRFYRVVTPRQP